MDNTIQELLESCAARLQLDADQQQTLCRVFEECRNILSQDAGSTNSMFQDDKSDDVSRACILWLLKALPGPFNKGSSDAGGQPAPGSCLPLSDLLNECGTNLVAFFQELPVVLAKLEPFLTNTLKLKGSLEGALKLREWQQTLVSLAILAKKYRDLLWRFVRFSGPSRQPLLQAGWLTFLLLKSRMLSMFPDLVSSLQLLVCVVNLMVANTPFSAQEVGQLLGEHPAAIEAGGRFNTLKALCAAAKIDYPHAKDLMPEVEQQFRQLLDDGQFSWAPPDLLQQQQQPGPEEPQLRPQAALLEVSCLLFVPDMLTGKQQLQELVLYLDQSYGTWYQQQGEIDERDFLVTDFGALASPRTRPGAQLMPCALPTVTIGTGRPPLPAHAAACTLQPQGSGAAGVAGGGGAAGGGGSSLAGKKLALGLQSPLPIMHLGPPGPATPVTQTMSSVSWLRSLTRQMPLGPPAFLDPIFAAAEPDARQVLCQQVEKAALAVFGGSSISTASNGNHSSMDHQAAVAKERREEGIKLYWHTLEAMLRGEHARSGLAGARNLLTRWTFHQCLLACSFEMVAAAYRMGLLSFPCVPNRLRLKPFDMSKMIGAFVHAEPTLPKELKRHLFTIEEKILESLAWQPGSSIYKLLEAATTQQQQERKGGALQQQLGAAEVAAAAGQEAMQVDAAAGVVAMEEDGRLGAQPSNASSSLGAQDNDSSGAAAAAAGLASTPSATSSEDGGEGTRHDPAAKRHKGREGQHSNKAAAGGEGLAPPPLPKSIVGPIGSEGAGGGGGGSGGGVGGGRDPAARAVLQEHCRKVLKLAAFRLVAISEGLDFSPLPRDEVLAAVHELVTHALYQHTHLFYGRHLDQLLLASLYGYCKVHRLPQITFKEIISHYRRQAHAKQEVYRTVVLEQTDPGLVTLRTGDIIAFYNQVFITPMKGYLLGDPPSQVTAAAGGGGSGSSGGGQGYQGRGVAARGSPVPHMLGGSPISSTAQQLAASSLANKSPIYAALHAHAAMQQQQQQQSSASEGSAGSGALQRGGSLLRSQQSALPTAGTVYRTLSLDNSGVNAAVTSAGGVVVPQWMAGLGDLSAIGVGAGGQPGHGGVVASATDASAAGGGGGSGDATTQQQQQQQQARSAANASGSTPVSAGGRAYVPSRLGRPSPVTEAAAAPPPLPDAAWGGGPAGLAGLCPGLPPPAAGGGGSAGGGAGGSASGAGAAAGQHPGPAAAGGGVGQGAEGPGGLSRQQQQQQQQLCSSMGLTVSSAGPAALGGGMGPQQQQHQQRTVNMSMGGSSGQLGAGTFKAASGFTAGGGGGGPGKGGEGGGAGQGGLVQLLRGLDTATANDQQLGGYSGAGALAAGAGSAAEATAMWLDT